MVYLHFFLRTRIFLEIKKTRWSFILIDPYFQRQAKSFKKCFVTLHMCVTIIIIIYRFNFTFSIQIHLVYRKLVFACLHDETCMIFCCWFHYCYCCCCFGCRGYGRGYGNSGSCCFFVVIVVLVVIVVVVTAATVVVVDHPYHEMQPPDFAILTMYSR